jgi:menaquinone-dependent protoporphyrinogen oxidase
MAATGARGHELFGGMIDRHRPGFAERAMLRAVGAKDGDSRDWEAIAAWVREIAAAVGPSTVAGAPGDQSSSATL